MQLQMDFLRDGYGPGDEVMAHLKARTAGGKLATGATVMAVARVEGQEVYRDSGVVGATGDVTLSFKLPDVRTPLPSSPCDPHHGDY